MKAERYVGQIRKLDRLITNKLIEREQLEAVAMKMTAPIGVDRVQSSGSSQKMADTVYRIYDLETEINNAIDKLYEVKKEVLATIEQLDDVEYDIIHRIFIQYMEIQDIADEYKRSYSWVTDKRRSALKNLQKVLNERN